MNTFHDKLPNPVQKVGEYQIVKTPVILVERMLDIFPTQVWNNKDYKWLVPVSKSGVFELGIYQRLMKGLADIIPDVNNRREWIVREMIWSFAPTIACELFVRRNYLGKVWDNMRGWDELVGNVFCRDFLKARIGKNGEVMVKKEADGKEKYVKFDCVVGNPPYQGNSKNDRSDPPNIYPDFVFKATELNPKYVNMVIPARWMSGSGKGISKFLKMMIECRKLSTIVSTENSKEWFSEVGIGGGTMYFLLDQSKNNSIVDINGIKIDLNGEETISTDPISSKIRSKIINKHKLMFSEVMLGRNPYGITSNFKTWAKPNDNDTYVCHSRNKKTNFISKHYVIRHIDTIDKYRTCVPNGGAEGISYMFVIPPYHVVSESHLVMGSFASELEAKNAEQFFRTHFAQYIISCLKKTQHLSKRVFKWLPYLDFSRSYTDQDLYAMFDLSTEEIVHIEAITKDFPIFRAKKERMKEVKKKFQEMTIK